MPSTFVAHAVDGDGDGRRDPWQSSAEGKESWRGQPPRCHVQATISLIKVATCKVKTTPRIQRTTTVSVFKGAISAFSSALASAILVSRSVLTPLILASRSVLTPLILVSKRCSTASRSPLTPLILLSKRCSTASRSPLTPVILVSSRCSMPSRSAFVAACPSMNSARASTWERVNPASSRRKA
ncbi:lytic murein transglycosylase [Pararhodospirillum photometricum]|uniref:lytic murein transglycosylase n=1 Tax=Pararhodospirillum photometricum TaxID=1084 RepID=UPI002412467B|nr:lytic murein transglycosylase [Pararhodospirillum photometricum]